LEDPGVDGWIILRWVSRNWAGGTWTGLSWLRIGTAGGHLFEPSGSIKCGEYLD